MRLLEFQAKEMLRKSGLPVPSSAVMQTGEVLPEVSFPVVVKSQVLVGGRGKAGGVKIAQNRNELEVLANEISTLVIHGHAPKHLLLEEVIDISHENYLSLEINRDTRSINWIVSPRGGINIESHVESVKIINHAEVNAHETICQALNLPLDSLSPLLRKLEQCMIENDLLFLEINPLALTADGQLVCADAKVLIDDNSRFRHEDFTWPESEAVKPLGGTIGVIANGAGMAMSTMDTIYASGAKPANFLDIGGGTGEDVFIENLRTIASMPGVMSIIVNIFAGITHCDDIARGIIAAKQQIPHLVPLFIRLEGTNRAEAAHMLAGAGISLEPDLATCVAKAKEIKWKTY